MAQRQLLADHAAHRQADPHDRAGIEFAQQARGIVGQVGHRVRAGWRFRAAVAAVVVGDHAAVGGEMVGQRVPHIEVAAERMAQHHRAARRLAAARGAHAVVQARAAVRHALAADARMGDGGRGRGRQWAFQLAQDLAGQRKTGIRGRDAGIDGGLHQHFLQLVFGETVFAVVLQGGAHVQLEFLPARQRHGGSQHDHAAHARLQARAAPDLVPGEARDQVLEFGVECVGLVDGAVHPGVAQDAAPVAQAALVVVVDRVVAH
jgi:hypothetical protein